MSDDGASPAQVLLGASRQNNLDLLKQTISTTSDSTGQFLNTATDPLGLTALHYCSKYGSLECLDFLLDQPGLDLDLPNRTTGDTALHYAVSHASQENPDLAVEIVEFLVDAGADVRVRNRKGDLPVDCVFSGEAGEKMRDVLEKAAVMETLGTDIVTADDVDIVSGDEGSGSD